MSKQKLKMGKDVQKGVRKAAEAYNCTTGQPCGLTCISSSYNCLEKFGADVSDFASKVSTIIARAAVERAVVNAEQAFAHAWDNNYRLALSGNTKSAQEMYSAYDELQAVREEAARLGGSTAQFVKVKGDVERARIALDTNYSAMQLDDVRHRMQRLGAPSAYGEVYDLGDRVLKIVIYGTRAEAFEEARLQQKAHQLGLASEVLGTGTLRSGEAFLIQGKAAGSTVRSQLGYLQESEARVLAQHQTNLAKLHANGLMHNDAHGDNVFIDEQGKLSFIDFGLATQYAEGKHDWGYKAYVEMTMAPQMLSTSLADPEGLVSFSQFKLDNADVLAHLKRATTGSESFYKFVRAKDEIGKLYLNWAKTYA